MIWRSARALATCLGSGLLLLVTAGVAAAQTPQGATLTIVSGETAVLTTSGQSYQPASSGLTLGVGDQVGTTSKSASALITFFEGSELEIGGNSTVILREIRSQGSEVHVTVEDVLGSTLGRVQAFANPNSTFSIQNPGGRVVALIRGSRARMTVYESGAVEVGVEDCSRTCDIQIEGGGSFSGTGAASFSVNQAGGVSPGTNTDIDRSVPGGSGGGSTGNDNPGTENPNEGGGGNEPQGGDSDDDEDPGYGYQVENVLTAELLRQRLGAPGPLAATGWTFALGLIGWSAYGYRPRRPR